MCTFSRLRSGTTRVDSSVNIDAGDAGPGDEQRNCGAAGGRENS